MRSLKSKIEIKKILLKRMRDERDKFLNLADKCPSGDCNIIYYLSVASRLYPEIKRFEHEIEKLELEELEIEKQKPSWVSAAEYRCGV